MNHATVYCIFYTLSYNWGMDTAQNIIQQLVRQFGMSQTAIAKETGIPQPRISRWASGDGTDSVDDGLALLGLLKKVRTKNSIRRPRQ